MKNYILPQDAYSLKAITAKSFPLLFPGALCTTVAALLTQLIYGMYINNHLVEKGNSFHSMPVVLLPLPILTISQHK